MPSAQDFASPSFRSPRARRSPGTITAPSRTRSTSWKGGFGSSSAIPGRKYASAPVRCTCSGRAERLQALWRDLTREQVCALRASIFFAGLLPGWLTLWALESAGSLFDPQPLRDMIASSLDLGRIRASPVRLLVVTTDLARRE